MSDAQSPIHAPNHSAHPGHYAPGLKGEGQTL